jgi:uncharacterized protein YrzB (UPF0473 family)
MKWLQHSDLDHESNEMIAIPSAGVESTFGASMTPSTNVDMRRNGCRQLLLTDTSAIEEHENITYMSQARMEQIRDAFEGVENMKNVTRYSPLMPQ